MDKYSNTGISGTSNKYAGATLSASRADNRVIYGLIFVIMVVIGRIQELHPLLGVLKLGKIAFALTFFFYLSSTAKNNLNLSSVPQMKYFFALYMIGLMSALFGSWPSRSFNFMFTSYLYGMLLLFLTVRLVNTYNTIIKIFWGILGALSLLGIKALMSGVDRVKAGSTYDSNDLAFVLVLFLPLTYFMMRNVGRRGQIILGCVIVLFLATIMATGSRGGFLGMVVVFSVIFLKERLRVSSIAIGGGVLLIALLAFTPDGYDERVASIFKPEQDYNRTASGGRIEIWKRGMELAIKNPLLGIGPEAFSVALGDYSAKRSGTVGVWMTAHSSFVQISTEFGIPAFVLFIMILYRSIRSLRNSLRLLPADNEFRWIIHALETGFYGYIVCGFFLSQSYSPSLFLLVGLTIAVTNQADKIIKQQVMAVDC